MTDTFVRLFWPRKLRELIKLYQVEGNLNPSVIRTLQTLTITYLIIFAVLAFVLFCTSQYLAFLILTCLAPAAIYYDINTVFNKNITPYVYGTKTKVKIIKMVLYRAKSQKIVCEDLDKGTNVYIYLDRKSALDRKNFQTPNDVIDVWAYDHMGQRIGMPEISFIKNRYSLKNS